MSNAAWRRFIGTHPHWHAPQTAPCGGKAAIAKLLGAVALGGALAAGGAAVGYHAPDYIASLPPVAQCCGSLSGGGVVPVLASFSTVPSPQFVVPQLPTTAPSPQFVAPQSITTAPRSHVPVTVPEPSSLLIFGVAAVLVVAIKRSR